MAGRTIEIIVGAVEDEARAPIVIESPDVPTVRVVACIAFRSERALVLVIGAMTGMACSPSNGNTVRP